MVNDNTKKFNGIPLAILDLAPIKEGSNATESFEESVELAQHAESWGYNRYWLAEHHNMPGIASSATSVLIGHIAGKTNHMRIGSGGIMLPNHATIVIAEQFGTLESIYPGRIDLGLGRAPGTDQAAAYALRRTLHAGPEEFPMQVNELQDYFSEEPVSRVRAIPGQGLDIPIWLLGSSDFSARLAAEKGLRFSFASHFAPAYLLAALKLYRDNFKPTEKLEKPYAMVGVNVIAADTDEKAQYLATSHQLQFFNIRKGISTKLQHPVKNMDEIWTPMEKAAVEESLDPNTTIIGGPETVKEKLNRIQEVTKADEIIISSQIYSLEDRLRSYEIISELMS
ncbi:LLM class flavin-dependent oxidoreductase [Oceanobacillus piezotolerans]|uniref:LLM class flavin-dependent oxidoreductase n=1 Tax=Oceanobacillus piezotolerans TaxID=2448030 RepID=A0A498D3G3_9BACI|nr:LLM class flavin-dependent oxidoreductase [Oceanobacillus piezotolerans]RLL42751.1 LLM class flavin-dependent oxidoreductase [Oceanobacillus piezotolerans]